MAQKSIDDEIDDMPAPKSRRSSGVPAPEKPRRAPRRPPPKLPAFVDDDDDPLDDGRPEPVEPIPFTNDEVRRIEQLMEARITAKVFKPTEYPAELPASHRVYWTELVSSFPKDHFTRGDIVAMKLYCRCAHDIDRCNSMIETEGDVIHGGRGPAVNPRVKVRQASEATLMNILTKFRNQPASRANSENFQQRQGKKNAADNAEALVEGDEDDLLGGRDGREAKSNSRAASYVN